MSSTQREASDTGEDKENEGGKRDPRPCKLALAAKHAEDEGGPHSTRLALGQPAIQE